MKLISEYNDYQMSPVIIEENAKGQKEYFIEGVFMQSEIKNRNGRVYPKEIMQTEVNRYRKEFVEKDRAFGELGHPEGPTINLDKVSHLITSLEEEGMEPLMINGLYAWIFRAIANIKINNNGQYVQNDFIKLRIFGSSQNLVINCINNLSVKQIEASLNKIKDIDLICKGLLLGNPWLELNRFVTGIARILCKAKV